MRLKTKVFILFLLNIFLLLGCGAPPVPPRQEVAQTLLLPPNNIALLLPFSGPLSENSSAIRSGFTSAYAASENKPYSNIKIMDTNREKVTDLYQKAITQKTDFIVGPLTKNDIEALAGITPLDLPTLALNTVDNYQSHAKGNLYQFGLTPQDEVMQAADKIISDHHLNAAVILPNNKWGTNLLATFRARFESQGGKVITYLNYQLGPSLSDQIRNLLGITDQQIEEYNYHKKQHEDFQLERRKDLDVIFIVASNAEARQIVPFIKFYFANDLPIYSISNIYQGSQPTLDQDLNGVYFCEMPWVIKDQQSLSPFLQKVYSQLASSNQNSFAKNSKFYALGIDAYLVIKNFSDLLKDPTKTIEGATGNLSLDRYNHIYRNLTWAQYRDGQANPL
jgi:uncharacterized protein